MAQSSLLVRLLLGVALLSGCSESKKVGANDRKDEGGQAGEDEPDQDEPEDSSEADDDDGAREEPAPEVDECMPPADDDEEPTTELNGGLDPASFPALEAAQFGVPKRVADGFTLAEGPVWDPCTNQLLFTDAEARQIHTLADDGTVGVYFEPTNYANGLAFDPQGRLLMAEMGGGKGGGISRLDRALKLEVLINRDPSCNKLNTSDDLAIRSDGTIYFTDPVISHGGYIGFALTAKPIYRLTKDGGVRVVVREGQASLPNGVRLSPDESTLYVAGYTEGRMRRFDVAADGALHESTPLATGLSTPDSFCVDAAGNLYVGVSRGLQVLRPDGSAVTLIPIPAGKATTNCAFGGEQGKTLFVTAWSSVWQLDDMPIPGNDWARNRDMPCSQ